MTVILAFQQIGKFEKDIQNNPLHLQFNILLKLNVNLLNERLLSYVLTSNEAI